MHGLQAVRNSMQVGSKPGFDPSYQFEQTCMTMPKEDLQQVHPGEHVFKTCICSKEIPILLWEIFYSRCESPFCCQWAISMAQCGLLDGKCRKLCFHVRNVQSSWASLRAGSSHDLLALPEIELHQIVFPPPAKCTVRVSRHHCTQTSRCVSRPHNFFWGDSMIFFWFFLVNLMIFYTFFLF